MELVRQFLVKCQHEDLADQLQQRYELPQWAAQHNPLLKKGLSKVVKEFIQHNDKAEQYYRNRVEPVAEAKAVSTPANSPKMQLRSDDTLKVDDKKAKEKS